DGRRAHQRARERLEAPDGRTLRSARGFPRRRGAAHLLVDFLVAGLEDPDQGAGLQLGADAVDLGELRALAEDVEERARLGVRARERDALVQDDGPRDEGEDRQQDQDALRDRSDVTQKPDDTARKRRSLLRQDEEGGWSQETSLAKGAHGPRVAARPI